MRTVITHFHNEEYLLPWWLDHHTKLFDYGILIDHGSTDNSVEICMQLAPHWRVVKSNLFEFDAFLTDFEVMSYEQQITGYKIALTITEFFVPTIPISVIERYLELHGRMGMRCMGLMLIDNQPSSIPILESPLIKQKHFGLNGNRIDIETKKKIKVLDNWGTHANRFYHKLPAGMYTLGRHSSIHPDYEFMLLNSAYIFKYFLSPWTNEFLGRKTQFTSRIPKDWRFQQGSHFTRSKEEFENEFLKFKNFTYDLSSDSNELSSYLTSL
jgi:hypothetical protein